MSDNGYVTGAQIRADARLDVHCPDRKYLVRRIGIAEMTALEGSIDLTAFLKKAKKKKEPTEEEAIRFIEYQKNVIVAGVCAPKISRDEECDDLWIEDVRQEDMDALLNKILTFSKVSREEAEKLRPLSPTQEP